MGARSPARLLLGAALAALPVPGSLSAQTWTADNGNGTYTNPLFYDEFSDPDLIRVGDDYYLTGTTMHAMPGLPVLHSRDLVNWRLLSYAVDRLDLGPEYRLEGGEVYGQGIWAPSFRHRDGTFYIFTNVNGQTTQVLSATDPSGPWTHRQMARSLHDLSVLFEEDGRAFAAWGYNEIRLAELEPDLLDVVPGSERVIIPAGSGIGEGVHLYRIDDRYYITSSNYDPMCTMAAARADRLDGPWEVTVVSARETLGVGTGWRMAGMGRGGPDVELVEPRPEVAGCIPLHQGGIVQTPSGEWWGFSMMDHNSIGRLTTLSPVTWHDGWPYWGLPGNLTRTPRTWVKPDTGHDVAAPYAPYERSDDFGGPALKPVWQWNHVPDDRAWSLGDRPGHLRLRSLPAESFWRARNTLTQRAVGPESVATVALDASGLRGGDVAGLALLNFPYAWLGVSRSSEGLEIVRYDQLGDARLAVPVTGDRVRLRVHADFDREVARFSVDAGDGAFTPVGGPFTLVFQLKTFQGVRYGLFHYNEEGGAGGHADFDSFVLDEPAAAAEHRRIPLGETIALSSVADGARLVAWNGFVRPVPPEHPLAQGDAGRFEVVDRGRGRVALRAAGGGGLVTVTGQGVVGDVRLRPASEGDATTFQWQDMLNGDVMLLSLATHRYVQAPPGVGDLAAADAPGAAPDRKGGACFRWEIAAPAR